MGGFTLKNGVGMETLLIQNVKTGETVTTRIDPDMSYADIDDLVEAICVTKGWNHYYTEWEVQ